MPFSENREARAAPCCALCTPLAYLTRRASHAAAPRPCAQHHSACAGQRRRAALLVPILSQFNSSSAGRHCEGRGSAARPRPRPALPASAESHQGACLPRAGCPFAPAARACASLLCCFFGGRVDGQAPPDVCSPPPPHARTMSDARSRRRACMRVPGERMRVPGGSAAHEAAVRRIAPAKRAMRSGVAAGPG